MMDLSIPYYEDNSRVSNSAIGWFLNKGPAYFHAKLSGTIEEEATSSMDKGTLIHMFLLQPEEYHKTYLVWSLPKPQSDKQEKFCQAYINSVEIEPDLRLLSAFKAAYSTTGLSEDKMLSKAKEIALQLKDYIEYLQHKDRILISMYDYRQLMSIQANIESHKLAKQLLNPMSGETHHEFHINWELNGVPCKSLLDSVNFDFDKKVCTLMDIKTTVKISHFEDSVNQYDYTRQLEFYTMALNWYLQNEKDEDPTKWTFQWYIIAIDTTSSNEVRVFKFTNEQIVPASVRILYAIEEINWHRNNNKWNHRREYYEGDGSEALNL